MATRQPSALQDNVALSWMPWSLPVHQSSTHSPPLLLQDNVALIAVLEALEPPLHHCPD